MEFNISDLVYKKNEDLKLPKTEDRPLIHFTQQTGEFEMSGRSILDDSGGFYARLTDWVVSYSEYYPNKLITLILDLEYVNTSGHTYLLGFIHELASKNLQVEWYYETEDQEEIGEEYYNLLDAPFTLINKLNGDKTVLP